MPTSDPGARIAGILDRHSWLGPLILFVAGSIAYVWLGAGRLGPIVDNDEYIYGNVAQSLVAGDGFTWRGAGVGVRTIYPYVIAPAWMLSDGAGAYELAKAINAVVLSAMTWPVWWCARELVGPRLALLPAGLLLLGMWMESSARLMTEAIALPAATLALCFVFAYLRTVRVTWLVVSLIALAVAVAARSHLVILVLVVAAAVTIDVLRRPRTQWREAARERRWGLVLTWSVFALAGLAYLFARESAAGSYSDVGDARPGARASIHWAVDYAVDTAMMVGLVPWIVSLALLGSRRAWRDDRIGPFLAILGPAIVVVIAFAGWFAAGVSLRPFDRYVFYLAPLLLIGLVAGLGWVRWRGVAVATAATAVLAVLTHHPRDFGGGAQAIFGAAHKLGLIDEPGVNFMWKLAVAVAIAGASVTFCLWMRQRTETVSVGDAPVGTAAATLAVCAAIAAAGMVLVSRDVWTVSNGAADNVASLFGGAVPDQPDEAIEGPKTLVASNLPPAHVLWVEFFNDEIDRVVVTPSAGAERTAGYDKVCALRIRPNGRFVQGTDCGAQNPTFVLAALPAVITTLQGQTAYAGDLDVAGLLQVSTGEPRFAALRTGLCSGGRCRPTYVRTWGERAGVLTLVFQGGSTASQVDVGGRLRPLPAEQETVVRVGVGQGRDETLIRPGWSESGFGAPTLGTLWLRRAGGRATRLN